MTLPTVTVTENTPYQSDPNTGEPMRPYNDLRGEHVAPTETHLDPGTYRLVREDQMEKVWWCGSFERIEPTPCFASRKPDSEEYGCGWRWLVKEDER